MVVSLRLCTLGRNLLFERLIYFGILSREVLSLMNYLTVYDSDEYVKLLFFDMGEHKSDGIICRCYLGRFKLVSRGVSTGFQLKT